MIFDHNLIFSRVYYYYLFQVDYFNIKIVTLPLSLEDNIFPISVLILHD